LYHDGLFPAGLEAREAKGKKKLCKFDLTRISLWGRASQGAGRCGAQGDRPVWVATAETPSVSVCG
jgi:hypothetical protein